MEPEENLTDTNKLPMEVVVSSIHRTKILDPRMFLSALIANTPMMSLIDTGATHTCLPSNAYDFLKESGCHVRKLNGTATVADGGTAHITGVVTLTLTLGKHSTWTGDVFLMNQLPFPLLIGNNTLEDLNAMLDIKNNRVSLTTTNGTEGVDGVCLPRKSKPSVNCTRISQLTFEDGTSYNLSTNSEEGEDSKADDEETYTTANPVPPVDFSSNPSMSDLELPHPDVSPSQ